MLFLILTIFFSLLIALILKLNEARGGNRLVVAATNYVVATILALAVGGVSDAVDPLLVGFGLLVGAGFFGGFFLLMKSMYMVGMAVPATVSRISTLVPVVGAMLVYSEQPSGLQTAGIATGIASFVMLGVAQRSGPIERQVGAAALWLLAGVFLVSGFVDFSLKIAMESGMPRETFLTFAFGSAALLSVLSAILNRSKVVAADLLRGVMLGAPNFLSSFCALLALRELPAVIVFPGLSAGVVLSVTLAGVVIWNEIPNRPATIGLALATLAVILLGLGT